MHGILLGGYEELTLLEPERTSMKRAAGAYRIASFLREEGWDIEVCDFINEWQDDEFEEFIESRVTSDTVFIGVSFMFSYTPKNAAKLSKKIQWIRDNYPDIALLGGSKNLSTMMPIDLDYYITGYGEYGLLELLKKLTNNDGKPVIQEVETDLGIKKLIRSDTHHPAYPCKDLQVRYQERDFIQPTEWLNLEFARGCKFKCKFCQYNLIGMKGNFEREMLNIHDELKRNYEQWGTVSYTIADETVNDSSEKLLGIANVVDNLGYDLNMTGYTRADLVVTRQNDWENMQRMGLWGHFYGIESFHQDAAKSIGKGLNVDRLKQGLVDCRESFLKYNNKYRSTSSLISGLPNETEESFDDGISWLQKNMPNESIAITPLFISTSHDSIYAENSSEFDRTAVSSGLYREGDVDDWNIDYNEIPELIREQVKTHFQHVGRFPEEYKKKHAVPMAWETDIMNFWEATKIQAKYYADITRNGFVHSQKCLSWNFHRWTTFGVYDLDDVINMTGYELTNDPRYQENDDRRNAFIEQYKLKKLSWITV